MQKLVKYSDKKVIGVTTSEPTTVVLGEAQVNENITGYIDNLLYKLWVDYDNNVWKHSISCKGVARLSPNDTYDALKGTILASRKAELNANKKFIKDYERILNSLNDIYAYMMSNLADMKSTRQTLEDKINSYK
jgi:hypothetical protein